VSASSGKLGSSNSSGFEGSGHSSGVCESSGSEGSQSSGVCESSGADGTESSKVSSSSGSFDGSHASEMCESSVEDSSSVSSNSSHASEVNGTPLGETHVTGNNGTTTSVGSDHTGRDETRSTVSASGGSASILHVHSDLAVTVNVNHASVGARAVPSSSPPASRSMSLRDTDGIVVDNSTTSESFGNSFSSVSGNVSYGNSSVVVAGRDGSNEGNKGSSDSHVLFI